MRNLFVVKQNQTEKKKELPRISTRRSNDLNRKRVGEDVRCIYSFESGNNRQHRDIYQFQIVLR